MLDVLDLRALLAKGLLAGSVQLPVRHDELYAAGGDGTFSLKPPENQIYIVQSFSTRHNDGSSRTMYVYQTNSYPETPDATLYFKSIANGYQGSLYSWIPTPLPFICTPSCYLHFKIGSLSAGTWMQSDGSLLMIEHVDDLLIRAL